MTKEELIKQLNLILKETTTLPELGLFQAQIGNALEVLHGIKPSRRYTAQDLIGFARFAEEGNYSLYIVDDALVKGWEEYKAFNG